MIIEFPQEEPAFISDLVTRQPINFDLNNIHLINTEIQTQWGVFMNGGSAEILNSDGIFIFMTGGNAHIIVFNSEVGEIDPRNYTGTLIYENSTWLGGYEIFDNSHIKIRGSVRMLPTVPIFDETSTMTRYYDVYVNNIHLNKMFSILISNPVKISLELEEDGIHYRPVIHVAAENPNFPFGTRESPYTAIQEAILNSGGDIIRVHPGTHIGDIEPGKMRGEIMLKDSVFILGAGADSTILTGEVNAENVSGAQIGGFTIEDGIHSVFSSLTITNNISANYSEVAMWGTHSQFNIINNVLANNDQDAIFLHDSTSAIIKNNIITNNGGFGINGVESA